MDKFNIDNFNDELKQFFNNIIDTTTYNLDIEEQSVDITFIYNDLTFNIYRDDDNNKLSITNNYYYELFHDNYEEILINKSGLKNVSVDEMSNFLEQLFLLINNI
jgi:hypothetical protein